MKGYLGGYIGARPGWSSGSQSGIWTLQERLAPLATQTVVISVAGESTAEDVITLGDPCVIYSVAMNRQAWLRIYDKGASRTADSARLVTEDPTTASGVLLEVRTSGDQTIETAPVPLAVNRTPGGSLLYPLRITNEAVDADVTVTITYASVLGVL